MRGIVAPLWNPGPLVLVLRRKSLPPNWMNALPLAPRQSVNIQPRQGSGAAGSPGLQGFELVQSLEEPSGKMGLVPGNLLQGLLIRQEALPSHVPKISLYLLGLKHGSFGFPLGVSYGSCHQLFRLFVGGPRYGLYDRTHQPGTPVFVPF